MYCRKGPPKPHLETDHRIFRLVGRQGRGHVKRIFLKNSAHPQGAVLLPKLFGPHAAIGPPKAVVDACREELVTVSNLHRPRTIRKPAASSWNSFKRFRSRWG